MNEKILAAHFSPWYAHRLFKELTGVSPAEYIRKLRLSEAAKQLKKEESGESKMKNWGDLQKVKFMIS